MPRNAAFSEALAKVSSEKIKERADGMENLRTIFQSQTSVENLSSVTEGAGWLQTFQTLFGVVKMERNNSLKKGKSVNGASSSSAAETRLSNAMGLVRWLVDRSLTHLNKKVINALFSHLTQTIITSDGKLLRNSMDYIKALKMIVSYTPHLEHLGTASWEHLMSICWDAALGNRIEYDKEEWGAGDLEEDSSQESESEEDNEEEDVPMTAATATTQKRKFTSTMSSIGQRGNKYGKRGDVVPLSTEATELLSIVPVLFAVPNAPILLPPRLPEADQDSDKPLPRAGIRILRRTIKFLRDRPAETTAHRSVLMTLNIVLGELELNAVQVMIETAPKLLSLLVPLWNTKLKDQVVLALRIILPFLSSSPFVLDKEPEEKKITREVFNDLVALRDAISRATTGKRSHILDLPFLSLRIENPPTTERLAPPPMHTPLINATPDFTDGMIMTWATLELMADSLALLHQHHEASSLRSTAPSTGSNKRQRVEEPVAEMLNTMTSARHAESRLFSLQSMYFFVIRHWDQLHDRLQVTIKDTLQHLIVDPVPEVQQWADINLAAICHVAAADNSRRKLAFPAPPNTAVIQEQPQGHNEWLEIWQLAMRKLIVTAGASSRSAALLLQVILQKQVVEPVLVIASIGKFLEGVSDQGPAAPYDAVCDFMVTCLDAADQDARLHRMGFGTKVSEWFRTAWLAQEKATTEAADRATFELASAFRLVCRLTAVPGSSNRLTDDRISTSSQLFIRMRKEDQILDIRDFILHSRLPPSPSANNDRPDAGDGKPAIAAEATGRPYAASEARALSRLFGLKLQQINLTDADASNAAKLRSKIDACILILVTESGFIDSDPEHSHANFDAGCELLESMLQLALQKNWTLGERAKLFAGIDALFPDTRSALQETQVEGLLCVPGQASGMLSVTTSNTGGLSSKPENATIQVSSLHVKLWQKPKLCDMFRSRVRDFYQMLQGEELRINSGAMDTGAEDMDDDFDAIKVDDDMGNNTVQNDTCVAEAIVASCIRYCLLPKYCSNGMTTPVKDRTVLNILINSDPSAFLQLYHPLLLVVRIGQLEFNDEAAASIYEALQDYLSSYTYSFSTKMRRAAADFVDTILSRLSPLHAESLNSGAGELVSIFLDWLGANLSQGKLLFWEDRLLIIRLFARLVELDPRNEAWSNRREDISRNDIQDPVELLSTLVEDTDTRIRYRLAIILARLFQSLPDRDFNTLYRNVLANFESRGFQVEYITSMIVFQLNVTIVSAVGRFNSLYHLYDTASSRTFARNHIQTSLQSVVGALRLEGISELYLQYAPRLALLQLQQDENPEDLPMPLYGFPNRKQWAAAALTSVGTAALLQGKTWVWEHLNATVGLSKEEGLHHIFSVTAGYYLALEFATKMQERSSNTDWTTISQISREFESQFTGAGGKGKLVLDPIDIISSIVCMPGEADSAPGLEALLQSQEDGVDRSRVFTTIYCTGRPVLELEEVLVPVTSARACMRVMQWIERNADETQFDNIIYNVLMQVLGRLDTKILINERMRLMRNLALFVAYHYKRFLSTPVLGFILLRTATLLAQHRDLVIIAANLISWILPRMTFAKGADADLVSLLARLSAIARSYVKTPPTKDINGTMNAGEGILTTLETFLKLLWTKPPRNIWPEAFNPLLPIWPRKLPVNVDKRLRYMSRAELLEGAQDPIIHTQVFSLTSQLADKLGVLAANEIEIFSSHVFWQLKDALSSGITPSPEEISAFLELCYYNGGRIRMIDPDTSAAIRTKAIQNSNHALRGRSDPTLSTVEILFAILDRLSNPDLGILHRAYQTLCMVRSEMSVQIQRAVGIPVLIQAELGLFRVRTPSQRISESILLAFTGPESPSEINLTLPMDTDKWVSMFASATCTQFASWGNSLVYAAPLFEHDRRLSRELLPQLLHLVLDKEASTEETEGGMVRDAVSSYLRRILQSSQLPLTTKTVVIEILLYLRRQNRPRSYNHLNNDYWLNLDFSLIAKAALDCRMYATALLYWELHVDSDSGSEPRGLRGDDYKLLYDIYNNIDEPDGFYGIPLESNVKNSLLQRFQHESNWSLAFKYYGAELEANGQSAQHLPQLTRSLQAFGMDKLALLLFQSGENSKLLDAQLRLPYDLAWRTQSWDLPATAFLPESNDRSIYNALRTIHRSRDVVEMQRAVQDIEREEVESIRAFSLEDVHGLRKKMKELLSLREIKQWCSEYLPKIDSAKPSDKEYQPFLEIPACIEPEMTEQIMFVRLSLIRSAKSQDEWQLGDMVADRGRVLLHLERQCLQQLGVLARQRESLNGAIKILAEQQSLTASDAADHISEFAEVLWIQGDHALAIDQLKNTLGFTGGRSASLGIASLVPTQPKLHPVMKSKLLSRVGQWMAEAKQAHPEVIYEQYFQSACVIMEDPATTPLPEDRAIIYSRFAGFADQEYARLLQLSELEQRHLVQRRLASENTETDLVPQGSRKGSAGASSRRTQTTMNGQLDEYAIVKEFETIKRLYLQYAIIMYARSMRYSEKYDDSVHRMCALWLENSLDNTLNVAIQRYILKIPTYKFAFLASQLTARLDAEDHKTVFQPALQALLKHLCEEHPFHIMYQVITLARTVQASTKLHASARSGKTPRGVNGRELAASDLLDQIRSLPRRTAQVSDMELFANASVSWCDFKQERGRVKEYQLPSNAPLARIQDLCIPVPTQHLPFDMTGDYKRTDKGGPAFIQSYERVFGLAGGLHMPKIMVCLGHDGARFRQLFKGDDDLRQDSVMEQVFSLVNTLLQRDEATAKRELRFKTYIVLPLANSTGIIEFVPDSIGIGDWLGEAHRRFRPEDMTPTQFRNEMKAIQPKENSDGELIKRFLLNQKSFKPVMRHFFTDMRNDPIGWYSMRLKYARSVAVGSIVGHLVGLGDRHCSNIMINTKTGEILHIDLGIAFDQGADLAIPERVPFRLTADMIDGLGSFGVEGVFKRCCEQTLRLLREKADLVLAVLEVFKHDPLQKWKADFEKVNQMQGGAAAKAHKLKMEAHASELAASALDRVRTKLLSTTSVEYTVNEWIRIATDPANLATIYHGWQPWL